MTNDPALAPVPRRSAAEAAADALRTRILGGAFAAGDRLPQERELAVQLGVSRPTLRAALRTLLAERLVAIRQGSGATVADFHTQGGPELIPSLLAVATGRDADRAIADLLAVRRALAAVAIERLSVGLSRSTHAALRDAIERFALAVARDPRPAAVAKADLDVTRAFVAATGSSVLQLCVNPIARLLLELPALAEAMYARPEDNVDAWRAVLALLASDGAPTKRADALRAALADIDETTLRRLARRRTKEA